MKGSQGLVPYHRCKVSEKQGRLVALVVLK